MSEENATEEVDIDLTELSDEDLVEFEAVLVADFEEKTADGVSSFSADDKEEVAAIVAAINEVRAAMASREEVASQAEIVGQVKGADFLAAAKARKAAAEAKVETKVVEPEAKTEVVAETVAPEVKAVADATDGGPTIVIAPKDLKGDAPKADAKGSGIVAAAGSQFFTPGSEVPDFSAVAKMFVERRPSVRGSDVTTDGARTIVASVRGDFPAERVLDMDIDANMEKINAVTSLSALSASGGLCAPLTPYYTLTTYGDAHRPVRDAFPHYKADRGGIRYMPAPRLTELAGSTRRTTAAQDAAGYTNQTPAGTTAPKPCLHVTCETEATCIIEAVSRCLTFGNMGSRTYPEQVEAWIKLGMAEFARYAETELLNAVSAASVALTAQQLYGSTYSLLDQISLTTTSFRSRLRLAQDRTLKVLMPFWATEIIRADIAAQAPGDGLARYNISDAQISDWFAARGASVTFFQDTTTTAGAPFSTPVAGALQGWPDAIEWFIFPEGSFLYLDGGVLDLGLVRDSTLNSQNDYQIFYEEFFGLCFIGQDSYKITSQVCPNGSYAVPTAGNLRNCKAFGS